MRIKSKDIAKALGISTATVSLVLNNKPGVNKDTRKKVFDFLEKEEERVYGERINRNVSDKVKELKNLVLMRYIKNDIIMERSGKYEDSYIDNIYREFGEKIRGKGYCLKVWTFYEQEEKLENFFKKLKEEDVRGIYIIAAEMNEEDIYPFLELEIPVVVGDNNFYEIGVDSFLLDNHEGLCAGIEYLMKRGHSDIVYMAENISIFNFEQRRKAFISEMNKKGCGNAKNRMIYLGRNEEEVYQNTLQYLDSGRRLPTAFFLESSVVSVGVIKALLARTFHIPRDISLVGFDALPPVGLTNFNLTQIKGVHTKRHWMAVRYLISCIEDKNSETIQVYYKTNVINGDSVFDKTKYIYRFKNL